MIFKDLRFYKICMYKGGDFFIRSRGSRLTRVTVMGPKKKSFFSSKSSKTAAGPARNAISLEIKRAGMSPAMHMLKMRGVISLNF